MPFTAVTFVKLLGLLGLMSTSFIMSGCHYYSDNVDSYQVSVSTTAAPNPSFAGFTSTVSASYSNDNVVLNLTAHDWSVVSSSGAYVLVDHGYTADFTPMIAGDYTLRYRTWYYTNYDYCCYATGYRESYVVVTAFAPPPG
jgi:hypothetical protein